MVCFADRLHIFLNQVSSRRSKGDVKILKNVWGMAGNEITAILGPSGAGESERLLYTRRKSDTAKGRRSESLQGRGYGIVGNL